VPDPLASTEFTYSRFLVPYLCDYEGYALFMDNDMLCLGDVGQLHAKYHPGMRYALRVVKHDHPGRRVDQDVRGRADGLPAEELVEPHVHELLPPHLLVEGVVETAPGSRLHRLEDIPDSYIGEVGREWNDLDRMDEKTKIVHWTSGGPWYEQYRDCPHADVWLKARAEAVAAGVLKV
jgi:hypothetical protein